MSQNKEYYSLNRGDGLWFNMVKITDENQKQQWQDYSKSAGYVVACGGVNTFQGYLELYNNKATEVWVAYVSSKEVLSPDIIDGVGIEMYMSVTTSEHAPFTVHMGIQRVPCENSHKNIAVPLHTFCARVMHEHYHDKVYMINSPEALMRDILCKAVKEKNCSEAISIYDTWREAGYCLTQEAISRVENQVHTASGLTKAKLLAKQHLMEDLLLQRQKIASGEAVEFINDDNGKVTFYGIKDGRELISFNNREESEVQEELKWALCGDMFIGTYAPEMPMIAIDLPVLAGLSDEVVQAPLTHVEFSIAGAVYETSL